MSYNGWSNYETWVVKLWMDNEEKTYRFWQNTIKSLAPDASVIVESREDRLTVLADMIQGYHEAAMPTWRIPDVYSDLLEHAFAQVDWMEIAKSMLEDEELHER